MIGQVDDQGRALITLIIRSPETSQEHSISAWIDTGFNGDLVLPHAVIAQCDLPLAGTLKAVLADGSQIALTAYTCSLLWFDELRSVEVVANQGEFPLVGVGLLMGRDVSISYRTGEIVIE